MDATVDFSRLVVLLVDDQEFVRKMVAQFLKNFGCRLVIEAGDGVQALSACRGANPDLAICDVNMKPLNGFEFLRQLRGGAGSADEAPDPDMPVIFLTAYDWGQVTKSGAHEVDGHLTKPVTPQALKTLIEKVVPGGCASYETIARGADGLVQTPAMTVTKEEEAKARFGAAGYTELSELRVRAGWWHATGSDNRGRRRLLQLSPYSGTVVREKKG